MARRGWLDSVGVNGKAALVLMRMNRGDCLVEYEHPARNMLHSAQPTERPTIQVRSTTINSLMGKAFTFPLTFDFVDGKREYQITDEGRAVARYLTRVAKGVEMDEFYARLRSSHNPSYA